MTVCDVDGQEARPFVVPHTQLPLQALGRLLQFHGEKVHREYW